MTEEIDQVVMKWQLAAIVGNLEDVKKYHAQYMKLALEFVKKQ